MGLFYRFDKHRRSDVDPTFDPFGADRVDEVMTHAAARGGQQGALLAPMPILVDHLDGPTVRTTQPNLAVTGVEGVATILAVRDTLLTADDSIVIDLDLIVLVDDRPPMPVTCREPVLPHLVARAQPGGRLRVKVDPNRRTDVYIDWVSPIRTRA